MMLNLKQYPVRFLVFLAVVLSAVNGWSASLVIRNNTGVEVKIKNLRNKCEGYIIHEANPVILPPGAVYKVDKTTSVVHTYAVCANGICSSSALGMKEDREYLLDVVLEDEIVQGNPVPDHWVGNLECSQ